MSEIKNKEIKVGILILSSIIILAIGYQFLKGSKLFGSYLTLHAIYPNIQGLAESNPVMVNGYQVGTVKSIEPEKNLKNILVTLRLANNIQIPANSIGIIVPNPIGNTIIELKLGNSNQFLKDGDSLQSMVNKGIVDDVLERVDPVVFQVKKVTATLDSLIQNINSAINDKSKNYINNSLANMEKLTSSLVESSLALNKMMNVENGNISKSLDHIEKITDNLNNQTGKINNTIKNIETASEKVSKLDIETTLKTMQHSLQVIDSTISRFNNPNGSLGLLTSDPSLYKNVSATSRKLNTLLDDIRLHPKRYMSVSLFGKKKDKTTPLTAPINDSIIP